MTPLLLLLACAGAPDKDAAAGDTDHPHSDDSSAHDSAPEPVHAGALTTLLAHSGGGDDVLLLPDGDFIISDPIGEGTQRAPSGERLLRVTPAGEVSVYAEGLTRPLGNDVDADGNIYAAEWGGAGRVFKVTPDREVSVVLEGLSYASNLVAHPNGSLYVTAWGEHAIYRLDPDGSSEVFAQGGSLRGPVGLALHTDGQTMLVSSFDHGEVFQVDPSGAITPFAELPESGQGSAGDLVSTALGVFVTSFGGHRVYHISTEGEVSVFAGTGARGGEDGAALEGSFNQPNGVALSADGRQLWVQEFGGALRVIEVEGGAL